MNMAFYWYNLCHMTKHALSFSDTSIFTVHTKATFTLQVLMPNSDLLTISDFFVDQLTFLLKVTHICIYTGETN